MAKYYIPHQDEYLGNAELVDGKIKYLDADDICSLGFRLHSENDRVMLFKKHYETTKRNEVIEIALTFIGDMPMITVAFEEIIKLDKMFCKNKSELQFILNRLNL